MFHGPGDVRLEEVPDPEPGRATCSSRSRSRSRTGPTRRRTAAGTRCCSAAAEPVRARVLRDRHRHRTARRGGELRALRRLPAVPARPGDALRLPAPAAERRLRRAAARSGADREHQPPPCSGRARAGGGRAGRAARLLPPRRRAAADVRDGRPRGHPRPRADRADALRLRPRCGGTPIVVGGRRERRELAPLSARRPATETPPTS